MPWLRWIQISATNKTLQAAESLLSFSNRPPNVWSISGNTSRRAFWPSRKSSPERWFRSASEREIQERDCARNSDRSGNGEGTFSRATGDADFLQGVAAGGGAADAAEQPRSGGGGEAGRAGGVRRDGEGGAELGMFSCDCAIAEDAGGGRDAAGAIGEAGGNFPDA